MISLPQPVLPAVARLRVALETIRREELDRYRKKLTATEAEASAQLMECISEKLLQTLIQQLEAASQRGKADTCLRGLEDLFRLSYATAS